MNETGPRSAIAAETDRAGIWRDRLSKREPRVTAVRCSSVLRSLMIVMLLLMVSCGGGEVPDGESSSPAGAKTAPVVFESPLSEVSRAGAHGTSPVMDASADSAARESVRQFHELVDCLSWKFALMEIEGSPQVSATTSPELVAQTEEMLARAEEALQASPPPECAEKSWQELVAARADAALAAGLAGEPTAQVCFLTHGLYGVADEEHQARYRAVAPGFLDAALARGDWRAAQFAARKLINRWFNAEPLQYGLIPTPNPALTDGGLIIGRMRAETDAQRQDFEDQLAILRETTQPTPQAIEEIEAWAQATFDAQYSDRPGISPQYMSDPCSAASL